VRSREHLRVCETVGAERVAAAHGLR
jgi:hypothetical protein